VTGGTSPRRILVVDDDVHIREILVQRLRQRGYDAEGASDGQDAMQKLHAARWDVLVLDLIMPRMSGTEVLRALENDPAAPPCIVISSLAEIWGRRAAASPRYAVLPKPFDFARLLVLIEQMSGRS